MLMPTTGNLYEFGLFFFHGATHNGISIRIRAGHCGEFQAHLRVESIKLLNIHMKCMIREQEWWMKHKNQVHIRLCPMGHIYVRKMDFKRFFLFKVSPRAKTFGIDVRSDFRDLFNNKEIFSIDCFNHLFQFLWEIKCCKIEFLSENNGDFVLLGLLELINSI